MTPGGASGGNPEHFYELRANAGRRPGQSGDRTLVSGFRGGSGGWRRQSCGREAGGGPDSQSPLTAAVVSVDWEAKPPPGRGPGREAPPSSRLIVIAVGSSVTHRGLWFVTSTRSQWNLTCRSPQVSPHLPEAAERPPIPQTRSQLPPLAF